MGELLKARTFVRILIKFGYGIGNVL